MLSWIYKAKRKLLPFEILMVGISVYSIVVVIIQLSLPKGSEMRALFSYFDTLTCVIFVLGFLIHLVKEPYRWQYLFTWGIIDLASAIPTVPLLRFLRLLRIFRMARLAWNPKEVDQAIQKAPSASLLYLMLLSLITIYTAACAGVLYFEQDQKGANITTGADALWFGLVTVSTVGYGGFFPVSTGARICSAFLMLSGISVFASLAGFLLEPLRRLAKGGRRRTSTEDLATQITELQSMLQQHMENEAKAIAREMEQESSGGLDARNEPEDHQAD